MAEERVARRLAGILVADMVGYARLVEADESHALTTLRRFKAELIDLSIATHHGRVVKLMGDGFIVEFASVVDAVACAVEIQKAIAGDQADAPDDRRITFRMGINLGDVVVDGDDLLGDGVNVAARLQQLCEPGGILVSGTAFDQLQGRITTPIDFIGEHRLKNISRPVRTYRVRLAGERPRRQPGTRWRRAVAIPAAAAVAVILAAGGAWLLGSRELGQISKPTVAVLPFASIGNDERASHLAYGLTEDIITDLSRYSSVEVIARNSTAVYGGKPVDVRQVGRELNVRYVLEGSVQHQADQIRVTAQLVDARTAEHLWSERWDRPVTDFFSVQSEISEQVASRLGGWQGVISAAEYAARRAVQPHDMTVYDVYVQGSEALDRFTKEGVAEAIPLLESVVAREPQFANAWATLAGAYQLSTEFGADPEAALPKARAAAERAIELDSMNADAHALLGLILGHQGDAKRSAAEFETALDLNPGSAEIMGMYSVWAAAFGAPERGAELADRAIRLNPRYAVGLTGPFSYTFIMAGRYEDALHVLEAHASENYTIYSWVFRPLCYSLLGRQEEAKSWVAKALEQYPDLTIEGYLGTPAWNDAERAFFAPAMRTAGFPSCARSDAEASPIMLPFLPECAQN
jgi:TolB-like protein